MSEIVGRTRSEIQQLANAKGLVPFGQLGTDGLPRKWKDPATGQERLRLDRGHTDPTTGQPYDNLRAAGDHVHLYDSCGNAIGDSAAGGDKHFPTTGD